MFFSIHTTCVDIWLQHEDGCINHAVLTIIQNIWLSGASKGAQIKITRHVTKLKITKLQNYTRRIFIQLKESETLCIYIGDHI